jgi:hypothetical protein
LHNNLIGRRIQQDVTNDRRIDGVRLKEHDELGRKVCECETSYQAIEGIAA